jgi:hypothetical protein
VFLLACQKDNGTILELKICESDVNKRLLHTPTREVYVETENQIVKIDFSLDERWTQFYINNDSIKIHTCDAATPLGFGTLIFDGGVQDISNLGELVEIYKSYCRRTNIPWSSSSINTVPWEMDSRNVFPKLHYALAQEMFRDDVSSLTRRAVLQMILDRGVTDIPARDHSEHVLNLAALTSNSIQTALFLITVILIKENDTDFIAAIYENSTLQETTSLNYNINGLVYRIGDICELVNQYAINFLTTNR